MKLPNNACLLYLLLCTWMSFLIAGRMVFVKTQNIHNKIFILIALPIICIAIPFLLGNAIPSRLMRVGPEPIPGELKEEVHTAIVFGFGYEKDGFKLTEAALRNLKANDVPSHIIIALGELKGRHFASDKLFLEAVTKTIGKKDTVEYQKQLLMHAENMLPGAANEFLLELIKAEYPEVTVIIVQEGVWLVACDRDAVEPCIIPGQQVKIKIYRMHHHDPKNYLNTFEAAFCAMEKMEELNEDKAYIFAHDLQLQRAIWDLETVRRHSLFKKWLAFTFVVPDVPDTPYPAFFTSAHFQTQHEFIYKPVELFYSRPRDLWTSKWLHLTICKAPVLPYEKANLYE